MLVFVDESGTHRQHGYSVIALICVADSQTMEELDKDVLMIERVIGTTDFHWAYKGWPFRREFIQGIAKLTFTIRLAQLTNPIKLDQELINTLPYLLPERNLERLFIDGKKGKNYERSLKKLLRDRDITVKKLRTVNDAAFPCIRIADAVAGAARYYLDNPSRQATQLYQALEPKIEFIHIQK